MKVMLIGNFPTCITIYQYLLKSNLLQSVCFQQLDYEDEVSLYWKNGIKMSGLSTFEINQSNVKTDFKVYLEQQSVDLVIVCGFGIKIPVEILEIPRYGFLNIHFGQLPQNRGGDPVFWTLKKGEKEAYVTIHKITREWDAGPVLLESKSAIVLGETYGMVFSKLSLQLGDLVSQVIKKITQGVSYKEQMTVNAVYNPKPSVEDTTIDWELQTATEIEQLVNACNPKFGGARTFYQGGVIKIMEVTSIRNQVSKTSKTNGEIVHAHPTEGLFVNCMDGQILQINVMSSDAGVLSGTKYVALGVQTGHCFTSK
ncbi:methionyl-tRNA formyltransferase [Flavobacterium faecale]|uniref:methionyl-tRNA formyltransferase n=1 Tax=Flavobacterium faecale TaxID=1355330 RepID=UPI003AB031B4